MTVQVWGIHNDELGPELLEGGFISISWDEIGDLRSIGADRELIKMRATASYPEAKPRAVALWAGTLYRFAHELAVGDLVVAPYRIDSTINIGRVVGGYEYNAAAPTQPHRRRVSWLKIGVSRALFSQPALYELGSLVTLFHIRRHAEEFATYAASTDDSRFERKIAEVASQVDTLTEWTAEEPNADRVERLTRDFVLAGLHTRLSHQEFEAFVADLLRAIGYQARVTPYSQDGGIDIIAHRDKLGIEPPVIKVQCKHQTIVTGAPDVNRLVGAHSADELGLFVTLGSYTKEARALEQNKPGLRLLGGEDVVDLVLEHYPSLSARWRERIPLRLVYSIERDD